MPIDHGTMAREVQTQMAAMGRDAMGMMGALPGAGAEQTVSPLINMITKMPGHIGFFSGLFEAIGAFFAPQLEALSNFGMQLGLDPSIMGHISLGAPEHMSLDLSLLPDGAPILNMGDLKDLAGNGMGNLGAGDMLSSKLNASLGATSIHGTYGSLQESLQISGPGSMLNKPVFEGGQLSGPSLSQTQPAPQLAGNNRLFSDSIGAAGHSLNGQSLGTTQSLPTNNGSLNVNGSTFGSEPAADLNSNQLLAMGPDGYQSTIGSMKANAVGAGSELGGMKAKALSLDSTQPADIKAHGMDIKHELKAADLKHGDAKHLDAKAQTEPKVKDAGAVRTHKSFDRLSHSVKPTHHSKPVTTETAKNPDQGPAQTKDLTKNLTKEPVKPQAQEVAQKPAEAQQQIAESKQDKAFDTNAQNSDTTAENTNSDLNINNKLGTDKLGGGEVHSYTIRSGDCLWNIARDHLGSAAKWSDIYKMNSDIIGVNPDLIRPGTTIQLPGAETATGGELGSVANYTVKPGDNLWDIAKNQLGDGTKWGDLYKANQEIIGANPRLIQPGQTLNLGTDPNQIAVQPQAPSTVAAQPAAAPQMQAGAESQIQAQAQAQVPQNYGGEFTAQQSMTNFEAMPVNHQISPPANLGAAKVVPVQSQPDAIIPPAHAATADEMIVPSANINDAAQATNPAHTASVVSTNLANDMMSMLKKRR